MHHSEKLNILSSLDIPFGSQQNAPMNNVFLQLRWASKVHLALRHRHNNVASCWEKNAMKTSSLLLRDYAYLVPYVENENEIFLKSIMPSRKATRDYLTGDK